MPEFRLPLRVYMEDTDAGGIVYYVNYLKYMERARTEFMRWKGYGKNIIFSAELMFVVSDAHIRYRQPARLDDEIVATAEIDRCGGAVLRFRQSVLRGEDILCEGNVEAACVDRQTLKPRRIPREMAATLRE